MAAPIFYPGFYPGKRPLYKKFKKPVIPPPDLVMEALNETITFDSAALGLPDKFGSLLETEFRQGLTKRYYSKEVYAGSKSLDQDMGAIEEEFQEMPGALGIGFPFDPEEWKKKGAEVVLKETWDKWLVATMGFKDLSVKAELAGIWDPLLNPKVGGTVEKEALSLHSSLYASKYASAATDFKAVDKYGNSIRDFIVWGNAAPKREERLGAVKENFAASVKDVVNSDPTLSASTDPSVAKLKTDLDKTFDKTTPPEEKKEAIERIWDLAVKTNKLAQIMDEAGDRKLIAWARLINYRDEIFKYNEYIDSVAEGRFIQSYIWKYLKKKLPWMTPAYDFKYLITDPITLSLKVLITGKFAGRNVPLVSGISKVIDFPVSFVVSRVGKLLDNTVGRFATFLAKKGSGIINALSGGALRSATQAAINWVLGAAGASGVGTVPAVVVAALAYLGEKLSSLAVSLFKLEFSKAYEKVAKELTNLIKMGTAIVSTPILIIFLLTYAVSGAVVAPLAGTTGTKAGGEGAGPGGMAGEIETNPNCGAKDGSIYPLSPVSSSSIVTKAYSIALGLIPGFWCFWNHYPNPPYDKFWDKDRYRLEPFPPPNVSGLNIFWCTYLVVYSYKEVGIPIEGVSKLANTQNMAAFFGYNIVAYRYDSRGRPLIKNGVSKENPSFKFYANVPGVVVKPGDAIFFKTPGRAYERLAHVAVVHSVSSEGVETIHSNASYKRFFFPYKYKLDTSTNSIQSVVDDNKYMEVWGFGRYEP